MKLRILALAVLLAGCTPVTAPTPPTPSTGSPSVSAATPTPTCTPAGGTPKACSPEELQQVRLNEETIALYKRWIKEAERLYRTGGTKDPTPEMIATTDGAFRKSVLGIFRGLKRSGAKAVSGSVRVVDIKAVKNAGGAGGASIEACIDGSSLVFKANGRVLTRGTAAMEYVDAKPVDGGLKLWSVSSEGVKSCPAG